MKTKGFDEEISFILLIKFRANLVFSFLDDSKVKHKENKYLPAYFKIIS